MRKWEYETAEIHMGGHPTTRYEIIKRRGLDGWQYIESRTSGVYETLLFEREVLEEKPDPDWYDLGSLSHEYPSR